jgi:predicted dehydrogenase
MNRKFLFIGYGSIAKQHIDNIAIIGQEQNFNFSIDLVRSSNFFDADSTHSKYIKKNYRYDEVINESYDAVFITNPTSEHYTTLVKYINNSNNIFIEKPVFDSISYDLDYIRKSKSNIYVACPLRYKKIMQYIKKNISFSDILSVQIISSSYLPDWRPHLDYRKIYSSLAELGGGVKNDLIHEWDYIHYLIGQPTSIFSVSDRISDLEINTEDIALYIASYENFYVEIHLDYFGKFQQRKMRLITKDGFIEVDLIKNSIIFEPKGSTITFDEDKNYMKYKEMEYFLSFLIDSEQKNYNDLEFAIKTLKFTRGEVK